jgi:hypothetical protein
MRVSISFDPHRGKPYISNLRTGNCFDALVKADVDLRVCATSVQVVAGSSCHAAERGVCSRHQRTDALIVVRTAVFTQDIPVLLPRQPTAARAQRATARAVSFCDPIRTLPDQMISSARSGIETGMAERTANGSPQASPLRPFSP